MTCILYILFLIAPDPISPSTPPSSSPPGTSRPLTTHSSRGPGPWRGGTSHPGTTRRTSRTPTTPYTLATPSAPGWSYETPRRKIWTGGVGVPHFFLPFGLGVLLLGPPQPSVFQPPPSPASLLSSTSSSGISTSPVASCRRWVKDMEEGTGRGQSSLLSVVLRTSSASLSHYHLPLLPRVVLLPLPVSPPTLSIRRPLQCPTTFW